MDFLILIILFQCPETEFINITTAVVASGDVKKDISFEIGLKKLSEPDDKELGEVLQL